MNSKQHFFYNITRKTILQFLDVLNDLKIARYNEKGVITKYIKVPVKFAPKTKQWYWEELKANNDRRDHVLPMMSVNLDSIEYSSDRQVNRHILIPSNINGSETQRFYNPVPYDFNFRVKIYAEYMVDITQIIEQIIPAFYPEAYIRITIPELNVTSLSDNGSDKLELRVVYDSSTKDEPVELDEEAYRVIGWELSFKVFGYLFTPTQTSKLVHKVVQNYYGNMDSWNNSELDVYNNIGDLGGAMLHGLSYSTDIPLPTAPVTDVNRSKYAYTHYPSPPTKPIRLYTSPNTGAHSYPINVEIKSTEEVAEIYYSVTNSYDISDRFEFIIVDPYPTYLITDGVNYYPTTLYIEPITITEGTKGIQYFGITPENISTNVYSSGFEDIYRSVIELIVSPESGNYDEDITVTAYTPSHNMTIYYTTDGTDPDTTSNIYTEPITVQPIDNQILRFRVINNNNVLYMSDITTRYYNV